MIYLLIPSSGTMPASARATASAGTTATTGTTARVTSAIRGKGDSRTAADRCAGQHITVQYSRTAGRGNAGLERGGAACGDDERR